MSRPQNLLFTANSPGEVAGWLNPLVQEARKRWPDTRVTVILLPCTFASGAEKRVAEELVGVDEVIPASGFWKLLFYGLRRYHNAALIHLGGDLMYAAALSWRWQLPTWSYLWGRFWWDKAFKGYFVKNSDGLAWLKRKKLPLEKAIVVGDLVMDSVACMLAKYGHSIPVLPSFSGASQAPQRATSPQVVATEDASCNGNRAPAPQVVAMEGTGGNGNRAPASHVVAMEGTGGNGNTPSPESPAVSTALPRRNLITYMPGSRIMELQSMTPILLATSERLRAWDPTLEFQLLLSPFLARSARTRAALEAPPLHEWEGVPGTLDGESIVTSNGTRVALVTRDHLYHLSQSRLALTIPGTKTAEAACLGIPELVVLPLNRPELLPLGGLLGLLDWVPGGRSLKGRAIMAAREVAVRRGKLGPFALPNIMAQRMIVPEIVDIITPEMISDSLIRLLANPQRTAQMASDLQSLYRPSLGAAGRMLDAVEAQRN